MYGIVKEYSEEQKCGYIVPCDNIKYGLKALEDDTLPKYYFNKSDVDENNTYIRFGLPVIFTLQRSEIGQLFAVKISDIYNDHDAVLEFYRDPESLNGYYYDEDDDTYEDYYASNPISIYEQQHQPQYRKDLANSLTDYLMNKPSVPQGEVGEITSMLSNVVLASLHLGGSVIQLNAQKQLNVLNALSKTYKFSLDSILKHLEEEHLLANEQKAYCFQFYQEYCTDMTASEKKKFMKQQNKYSLAETTIKTVGGLAGGAMFGYFLKEISKIWSPSYQKTERYRIKNDTKKK